MSNELNQARKDVVSLREALAQIVDRSGHDAIALVVGGLTSSLERGRAKQYLAAMPEALAELTALAAAVALMDALVNAGGPGQ